MSTVWRDLLLAARLLRLNPGFTLGAVLTIGLGIGANATIFSFADALLLRPLPVADADRIVHIFQRRPESTRSYPLSYADYLDYRAQARSFEALAAHYATSPMHVVIEGEPQAVNGAVVTATYFELLALHPAAGRFFLADEDRVPGRDTVAVISHGLWERRFARNPQVVGRSIRINGEPFAIVGIAPSGFTGVHNGGPMTDIWIPTAMFRTGYRYCDGFDRGCTIVAMLGRLHAGVSVQQAQQELDVVARQLAMAYPATNENVGVRVVPARGQGYGPLPATQQTQLQLFLAAVGLVLLIGCANVAGLLLARAMKRRKEIAIRLALGATRGRLVRQLLSESLLLAAMGGGAGLLLAFWTKDLLAGFSATDYAGRPRDFQMELSALVILATSGLTLLASVAFGLAPAIHASKSDILPVLKDEGGSGGARRARLRQALVVGQIGLAVLLVIGAGLVVRSLQSIFAGPGFDLRPVVTVRLRPGLVDYPIDKALAYQRLVISRLEALPGVVSASPADGLAATPAPEGGDQTVRLPAEGGQEERTLRVRQTRVGPRYFFTLGVPVLEGREFEESDHERAPRVVVINDVLARQISPDARVSGRTLIVADQPHQIVGVIKDSQYYVAGEAPHAVAYHSYWQPDPQSGGFNKDSRTLIRVVNDASALMPMIRRELAGIDPAVPISEDYPLSSRVAFEFQSVRLARSMLVSFGALALFLSAVGLYGVLAFSVSQRTREIGVRIALGASRRDIATLVVRNGLAMTIPGAALGMLAALTAARFVSSFLYGVHWTDISVFLVAPVILGAVAVVASYLPARRAARVSPLTALRYE